MNMVALTMMVMLVISFTMVTTGGFRRVKCLEDASETRVPLSTGGDTITITAIISIIIIVIIIIITTTIFIFTMIAVSQNGGQ